ncbi:type II toxin-antitoxin system HicA family toxin [Candidatus Saganbacteria bacterium]|nr:type II toxin-antitoxin system HicA family toxin [Candidatus Saganbacteria bacterium]
MKLPNIKPKEIIKILQRAGFYIDHQSGGHITLLNDKAQKRVTLPSHPKEVKKGTLHSIIKQSGLSREEFIQLR